jgi:thiamine-monophosphate kinase
LVGTIGDAAAGLALLRENESADGPLVDIYRRPVPQLEAGRILAPYAHAMMDVSDGLLLDSRRMADASRCAMRIEIDQLPLSSAFIAERGQELATRLFAATGGDDYALLAAFPSELDPATLSLPSGTRITRIGAFVGGGPRLALTFGGEAVELPERLGFEHEGSDNRRLPSSRLDHRP